MKARQRAAAWAISIILAVAVVMSLILMLWEAPRQTGTTEVQLLGGYSASPPSNGLLDELNANQSANGSWGGDLNATAISICANAVAYDGSESTQAAVNWTAANYSANEPLEAANFLLISNSTNSSDVEFDRVYYSAPVAGGTANQSFIGSVAGMLAASQLPNGSWNDDVSDTALATYALAKSYGSANSSAARGAAWLKLPHLTNASGTAPAGQEILALSSTGSDVSGDLDALGSSQAANGSFGDYENTSWAVMALSEAGGARHLPAAARGVEWLRAQRPEDGRQLALAALSEQYYNAALERERLPSDVGFSGPSVPWQYIVAVFVISSLGVVALLFSRLREDEVMGGIRKEIYDYISQNPGDHLASITRRFSLSSSSARYHLWVLECTERVVIHKTGKHKHYYLTQSAAPIYTNGFEYKDIVSALRNDTSRGIVKYLLENDGANQKAVAGTMSLHPSTVNWHARRLEGAHIIDRKRSGKDIHYFLNREIDIRRLVEMVERSAQ